ncbi:MAG: hypothetical protein F4Y41_03200 [Gammaproteobacteria bacterium]|nr:hypothetical protein [Gammaproteobacteria bacterium]
MIGGLPVVDRREAPVRRTAWCARLACHAPTLQRTAARFGMRRPRHWPIMARVSISVMFSQPLCFGV